MSLAALAGAIAVGLSLGVLGSGGSILTVPVLRTLVGHEFKLVVCESLGIVGIIAAAGAVPFGMKKLIDVRAALRFGVMSIIGTQIGSIIADAPWARVAQPAVFIVVMLAASFSMIRGKKPKEGDAPHGLVAIPVGLGVGLMIGFVGVGGGFLIVPALVVLLKVPMHRAVGTSLCLVAVNAFSGFVTHLRLLADSDYRVDWTVFATFSAVGVVGSIVGSQISRRVPQEQLRRIFGVMLIAVAAWLSYTEYVREPGNVESIGAQKNPIDSG